MLSRPESVTLNPHHPWASNLILAVVGNRGRDMSDYVHDSGPYGLHGTMQNMEVATDTVWDTYLNRFVYSLGGTNEAIFGSMPTGLLAGSYTISFWYWSSFTTNQFSQSLFSAYDGTNRTMVSLLDWDAAVDVQLIASQSSLKEWRNYGHATSAWNHLTLATDGTKFALSFNGGVPDTTTDYTADPSDVDVAGWAIGCRRKSSSDQYYIGGICDVLLWNVYAPWIGTSGIADPSNRMLSGLLRQPMRKFWPVVSGSAPASSYSPWLHGLNGGIEVYNGGLS